MQNEQSELLTFSFSKLCFKISMLINESSATTIRPSKILYNSSTSGVGLIKSVILFDSSKLCSDSLFSA
jgi:hypothetical protein